MDFEYDSDKDRWKYYEKAYKDIIINTDKLFPRNNRLVGTFSVNKINNQIKLKQVENKSKENCIELSGDCFFNFNEKKYERYIQIAQNSENAQKSEKLKNNLLEYKDIWHHSNANCVLLPVTGALNNVKGNIYFKKKNKQFKVYNQSGRPPMNRDDRPDTFIHKLSEFWDIKSKGECNLREAGLFLQNSVFSHSLKGENFAIIYDFLNSFNSLEEFCNLMFGIDENLVSKMKNTGRIPITDIDSLEKYLNLANEFWNSRKKIATF